MSSIAMALRVKSRGSATVRASFSRGMPAVEPSVPSR